MYFLYFGVDFNLLQAKSCKSQSKFCKVGSRRNAFQFCGNFPIMPCPNLSRPGQTCPNSVQASKTYPVAVQENQCFLNTLFFFSLWNLCLVFYLTKSRRVLPETNIIFFLQYLSLLLSTKFPNDAAKRWGSYIMHKKIASR